MRQRSPLAARLILLSIQHVKQNELAKVGITIRRRVQHRTEAQCE